MTSFFRSKAQFYRSYRTLLPCSAVIGNLAEHRPSVHSVSASCIPGKFLDNSEVVVLIVRILYNQEILRHKLRGAIHSTKIQTGPTGKKRTTSKGGPVFLKLFRLDRTDPLSFGPKFPEILVEWIAPRECKKPCICMCVLC